LADVHDSGLRSFWCIGPFEFNASFEFHEVFGLRPNKHGKDRPKLGSKTPFSKIASLSCNGKDRRFLSGLRGGPYCPAEAWWVRFPKQYAMADSSGGEGERQDRVAHRYSAQAFPRAI